MQRMMCISEEQYDRMLESYNGAVEELQELRELLQMTSGGVDEVAPVQPRAVLGTLWIPLCRLMIKP